MSYGACACCGSAVAAWSLPAETLDAIPESKILCLEHLRKLLASRKDQAARQAYEDARAYCPCGREILLKTLPSGAPRPFCGPCLRELQGANPFPAAVNQRAGDLSLRVDPLHYTFDTCEANPGGQLCSAKMAWRMTRLTGDPVLCVKHGGGQETMVTA